MAIVDPFDDEQYQGEVARPAPSPSIIDPFDSPEYEADPNTILAPSPQMLPQDGVRRASGEGWVNWALQAPGAIRDAYMGDKQRTEDLPEWSAKGIPPGKAAKIRLGLIAAVDTENQANVLKEQLGLTGEPGSRIVQDDKGNWIVEYNGTREYVNRPGMTYSDVTQFVGQTAAYVPSMFLGRGQRMVSRVPKVAGGAGATSLAIDKAAETQGADETWEDSAARAAVVAGTAGTLEAATPVVVAFVKRVTNSTKYYDQAAGKLTPEGEKLAKAHGLNPADMEDELARQYAREAEYSVQPENAARQAKAREFDVNLTRGEAAEDFALLAKEEGWRHGGDKAGDIMRAFDERRVDQLAAANEKIRARFSGGVAQATREGEAGGIVAQGLQKQYDLAKEGVDEAYRLAEASGALIPTQQALRTMLPNAVRRGTQDVFFDPELTPVAYRARKMLGKYSDSVGSPSGLKTVLEEFSEVGGDGVTPEIIRRRLLAMRDATTNATDRRAMNKLIDSFDDWMDEAFDTGNMKGGDLDLWLAARDKRREMGQKFGPQNKHDQAGKVVEKILSGELTDEQVAAALMGKGSIGNQSGGANVVKRMKDIFGPDSPEVGALRELVWLRMSTKGGKGASATTQAKELLKAFEQNRSLMDELYTPEQIATIERFRDVLNTLTKYSDTKGNPSKTGYTIERLARQWMQRLGTMFTFSGNPGLGALAFTAARTPHIWPSGGAKASLRPLDPELPKTPYINATGAMGVSQQTTD